MALGERRVLDQAGPPAQPPVGPAVRRPIPWVSYALIALCAAVFVGESAGVLPSAAQGSLQLGALYGPAVHEGQWWRVLGTVFEHGGVLHIVLNMSVVYTLGFNLERAISSWRFFIASLVAALGAAAFALLFSYDAATVGASGVIVGWAGVILPIASKEGRRQMGTWILQIALISILPNLIPGSPLRVSWQGHLGGFLFGLPCGFFLRDGAKRFQTAAPFLVTAGAVAVVLAEHFGTAHG